MEDSDQETYQPLPLGRDTAELLLNKFHARQ